MSNDGGTARNTGILADLDGIAGRHERLARWLVFLAYIAIVVFTAAHHEMWRDEVRALSMAREGTLGDLFGELRYEGHPAIWYLLLRAGYFLTGSRLVLPVLSLLVAAATVYLLLRFAPFSWPQKILLVLGVFPLFEYSVVARNYGLGMLLIVILAVLYPVRLQRPVLWGLLLALLANTSLHAAVIAVAIGMGTGWDFLATRPAASTGKAQRISARRVALWAAIGIAGLIAARATVSTNRLPGEPGMPRAQTVAHQMALSALNPGRFLGPLLPSPVTDLGDSNERSHHSTAQSVAIDAILLTMVVGLWGEWSLLLIAVTAVSGSGALFAIVHGANMRHLGLLWFLFVMLYWEMARRQRLIAAVPAAQRLRVRWCIAAPLTAVMVLQAVEGVRRVHQDVTGVWSSSQAIGVLLRQPEYRAAILMATKDNWLESVAYYSPNRLYFHDQGRFESHAHFALPFLRHQSIQNLIAIADTIGGKTGSPILLLMSDGDLKAGSAADSLVWQRRTIEVAGLNHAIGDESYHVRLLATPADTSTNRPPN